MGLVLVMVVVIVSMGVMFHAFGKLENDKKTQQDELDHDSNKNNTKIGKEV
jgi:hypothetical protein